KTISSLSGRPTSGKSAWDLARPPLRLRSILRLSPNDRAEYRSVGSSAPPVRRDDSGQARRVAGFLLAWQNSEENGGWDPTDLWNVDAAIAEDMLTALRFLRTENRYPGDLGFQKEIDRIWEIWRGSKRSSGRSS